MIGLLATIFAGIVILLWAFRKRPELPVFVPDPGGKIGTETATRLIGAAIIRATMEK